MHEKSSVFNKNYEFYLLKIKELPLKEIADDLKLDYKKSNIRIPLLGEFYSVSSQAIVDQSGKRPDYGICILLFKYLLTNPTAPFFESPWTSYKDFKDAGPLISFFSHDVERPVETHFSGKADHLKKSCEIIGGKIADLDIAYDVSMKLTALPKIPVLLLFNDADNEFSAGCSILFQKSIETYLDMESVAILGQLFSRTLIKNDQGVSNE